MQNYSFDWKGFGFFLKLLVLLLLFGFVGHYGYLYAQSRYVPAPVLIAVQDPVVQEVVAQAFSTTTPIRIINSLTISKAVPAAGKFIAADLVNMKLYLYQDGTTTAEYPILTKGMPGTPYETPSGFYSILTKETNHVNGWERVNMPYSMEFYGNYFIHGWPTYQDGTPVASTYSGGCIRLSTADAAQVYAFAERGTDLFVYDTGSATSSISLALAKAPLPALTASSYLVADIDTGDVYAEQNAQTQRPIASVTKLMTALVANETIMFDHRISVPRGKLQDVEVATDTAPVMFVIGDLLYPLLMESNNNIADTLANYYGTQGFVAWMNKEAKALDMNSTTFKDASGISPDDASTPEDLYRLAVYLANKKSFIWKITRTPNKVITAKDGSSYSFSNFNKFYGLSSFVGGKVGHTTQAQDTMVSVFTMQVGDELRRIAVVVLDSDDYTADTQNLAAWFNQSATQGANSACASCSLPPSYRKIQL